MAQINNPILPGFHPDPSIVRVGEDYYIATSTFEWYPGISIYHSKDLIDWQLIARPLNRLSQLDMRGEPDSCGVWAPCLSYHQGQFYLVFTDVKRFGGDFKDTHNYIVSTDDIRGDWSDPVYVNSSGFDPSLFFDQDGTTWFLNMIWDHRPVRGRNNWAANKYFGGVVMQQYDLASQSLVGESHKISSGTDIGLAEGPHLYQRDGWYYLLLAEGGTGKDHACSFLRSKQRLGPYVPDPKGPIVTSAVHPTAMLKRAGHGDWVETAEGDCFLVHLCGRPLPYRGRCVMGRETAIQPMFWDEEGWPRLSSHNNAPLTQFEIDGNGQQTQDNSLRIDFDHPHMPLELQSLRFPLPETTLSLTDRPGYLRLYGKESLGSLFHQALVARRQQAFRYTATTRVDFQPQNFQQLAGLVCYYNSKKHYYLHITTDESGERLLDVSMNCNSASSLYPMDEPVVLPAQGQVELRAEVNHDLLQFSYRLVEQDDDCWHTLPLRLDYSLLSDEVGEGGSDANFTGAFVGLCCQDISGNNHPADFAFLDYQEYQD